MQKSDEYIIITNEIEDIKKYPNIEQHLLKFKKELDGRFRNFTLKNADKEKKWWFMYGYRPNTNFEGEKILIPYRSSQNNFVVSRNEFYSVMDIFYIDICNQDYILEYLSCVLSSKFIYYYLLINCKKKGDIFEFVQEPLKTIPIPQVAIDKQQPFVEKAQQMLDLTKQLSELSGKFIKLLSADLSCKTSTLAGEVAFAKGGGGSSVLVPSKKPLPDFATQNSTLPQGEGFGSLMVDKNKFKITKKLEKWYNLQAEEFFAEVGKQNKNLSLSQKSQWLEHFEEEKNVCIDLQNKINETDKKIDKMVYALYGLTDDEIKNIENN